VALLAQQELLEVPPARRLIVPRGHSAWWGVDPSTLRLAVAGVAAQDDGVLRRWVRCTSFAPLEGAQRLSALYTDARRHVEDLAACNPWPGLVMVEQPSGSKQSVNLPLIYAVGVIQMALYDGLLQVTGSPVRIESCTSSWWKKRACGRGDIFKPKKDNPLPYGVLTWARANGYDGSSWDCADAWGVAEAARRSVILEER
jgi:hypothetical protein